MRVQDVMTDEVYKVSPDTTAEDAWNLMRMRRIHHLVVLRPAALLASCPLVTSTKSKVLAHESFTESPI